MNVAIIGEGDRKGRPYQRTYVGATFTVALALRSPLLAVD